MLPHFIYTCIASLLGSSLTNATLVQPPDIAIFLTDQQQAAMMSIAGAQGLNTPTMDTLALQGVRFTHAYCPTPQCSPTRSAYWTGRYPHRTGVMGNVKNRPPVPAGMSGPLDHAIPNIAKIFAPAGYETVYFGKWHLGGVPCDYGFETCSPERLHGEDLTVRAIEFLQKRRLLAQPRRPLLFIVSWVNPHDIYQITKPEKLDIPTDTPVTLPKNLRDDLRHKPFPQRHFLQQDQGKVVANYTDNDWKRYIRYYRQLTETVDAQIGRVLAEFRLNAPQSLVIFASDHGDSAGSHGLPFKSPAMYEELVRVPLIFSWPDHLKAGVSDALVSPIDLLPTLCDLANIKAPEGMDGRSLRPLLNQPAKTPADWRDAIFVEYYGKQNWRAPIRMIRTERWKYVRYLQYGNELYDLNADPHEMNNLAGKPAHADRQKTLADRLDQWISQTRDPFNKLTVTDRAGKVLTDEPQ